MLISEALEKVNEFYVPGCVAHYEKQNPDLWQQAHDEMEKINFNDPDEVSRKATWFVERCKTLVDRYIQDRASPAKVISISDAFALGSEERLNEEISKTDRACWFCKTTTGVKIEMFDKQKRLTRITCMKHKAQTT